MDIGGSSKEDVLDEVVDTLMGSKGFFIPMTVSRGRKFRGNCFWLSQREVSNGGFSGSGVRPKEYYLVNTAWDPAAKREAYFNGDIDWDYFDGKPNMDGSPHDRNDSQGIEKWEASYDEKASALMDYVDRICDQCVSRCGNDRVYRMRWLRKVFGLPTDLADKLAGVIGDNLVDESTRITLTMGQLKRLVREELEYLHRFKRRYDPNRREFLIYFNDTKFDPMDSLYHRDMRVFAKDEREALILVRDEHPEFKVTKITRI